MPKGKKDAKAGTVSAQPVITQTAEPLPGMRLQEGQQVKFLPLDLIADSEVAPREQMAALATLKRSIKASGVLEPLIVRQVEGGYEVVHGNRRLEAARLLKLSSVPCIVKGADNDSVIAQSFVINTVRAALKGTEKQYLVRAIVASLGKEKAATVLALTPKGIDRFLEEPEEPEEAAEGEGEGEAAAEPPLGMISLERKDAEAFIKGKLTTALVAKRFAEPGQRATVIGILGTVEVTEVAEVEGGYQVSWQSIPSS